MESGLKGIFMAISVILVCILLACLFLYYRSYKNANDSLNEPLIKSEDDIVESDLAQFIGDKVSGEKVQYFIKRWDDYDVEIVTNRSYNDADKIEPFNRDTIIEASKDAKLDKLVLYTAMTDNHSKYYINPEQTFAGIARRDNNGSISMIKFVQQNYKDRKNSGYSEYVELSSVTAVSALEDNCIYSRDTIVDFLKNELGGTVNYAVTISAQGRIYYFSKENLDDVGSLSSEDFDVRYLAHVYPSKNNSVYIYLTEQNSTAEELYVELFKNYKAKEADHYFLVKGTGVLRFLTDYSSECPFDINLITYDGNAEIFKNTNPFKANNIGTTSYVDTESIYKCTVTGNYIKGIERTLSLNFTRVDFQKGGVYYVTTSGTNIGIYDQILKNADSKLDSSPLQVVLGNLDIRANVGAMVGKKCSIDSFTWNENNGILQKMVLIEK